MKLAADVIMIHLPTGAIKSVVLAPFSETTCKRLGQSKLIQQVFHASVQRWKYVTTVHVVSPDQSFMFVGRTEDFALD